MYLTAHQGRSPLGQEGINAFLSLHHDQPLPLRASDEPDIDVVSRLSAGYAVAEDIQIRPGGNEVSAYLDLAAADSTPEPALREAVAKLKSRIGSGPLPITLSASGVTGRFGAVPRLEADSEVLGDLLDRLSASALALLARRHDPPRRVTGPYVVWGSCGPEGIRLWLPPATLLRLPQTPARRFHYLVSQEVLRSAGPLEILRHACVSILSVGEEELKRENGVEILDPRTGKTLVRYSGR